jgi:threonine dehydrogenase-like Zn-dependent dehydrogenase
VTAAALDALVERLLELLRTCRDGPVEVVGDDPAAESLRERLRERVDGGSASDRSPAVVIDASGSPDRIRDALRRLEDLGTLVLTRSVQGGGVSVNLYADLHFRSLTVIGTGEPALPS